MTTSFKTTLGVLASAGFLLAVGYSTMKRAERAQASRLDWRDITALSSTKGPVAAARAVDERLLAHPNDAIMHYFRARLYYEDGRAPQALAEADRAIALGYAQEISHLLKALVYGRLLNDRAQEKKLATKALGYDPTYDDGYMARAEAEYRLGEYGPCVSDAASFSSLSPEDPYSYELSLLCLSELKDFAGAEKAGARLLKLEPNNHEALWRLGLLEAARGRHEEAVRRFSEAIRLSGGRPSYYLSRASSCRELGDFSCEAWDLASASDWKSVSSYATYYVRLGEAMHRVGELELGMKAAGKALEIAPAAPAAHVLRGRLRAEKGDLKGAAADFRAAEALAPGSDQELPGLLSAVGGASKSPK
ncbi:MAG: tetratricopeptide repeat protein [Elusimicrobia bacterium]|nr:tetratricopeptide repeat protein [Elusimicrobiota bacterium]